MAARKKTAKKKTAIKRLPANSGSPGAGGRNPRTGLSARKNGGRGGRPPLPAHGGSLSSLDMALRDFEKIVVHFDKRRGYTVAEIARRRHLSREQIAFILATPLKALNVTSPELDRALRMLTVKNLSLADDVLDAITEEDIKTATLMQKVTAAAISTDKAVQMDKHTRGTKDNTGGLVAMQSRVELDAAIKRKELELGIIKDADFEVLEPVAGANDSSSTQDGKADGRDDRPLDGQLDLFTRNQERPELAAAKKEVFEGEQLPLGIVRRKRVRQDDAR